MTIASRWSSMAPARSPWSARMTPVAFKPQARFLRIGNRPPDRNGLGDQPLGFLQVAHLPDDAGDVGLIRGLGPDVARPFVQLQGAPVGLLRGRHVAPVELEISDALDGSGFASGIVGVGEDPKSLLRGGSRLGLAPQRVQRAAPIVKGFGRDQRLAPSPALRQSPLGRRQRTLEVAGAAGGGAFDQIDSRVAPGRRGEAMQGVDDTQGVPPPRGVVVGARELKAGVQIVRSGPEELLEDLDGLLPVLARGAELSLDVEPFPPREGRGELEGALQLESRLLVVSELPEGPAQGRMGQRKVRLFRVRLDQQRARRHGVREPGASRGRASNAGGPRAGRVAWRAPAGLLPRRDLTRSGRGAAATRATRPGRRAGSRRPTP